MGLDIYIQSYISRPSSFDPQPSTLDTRQSSPAASEKILIDILNIARLSMSGFELAPNSPLALQPWPLTARPRKLDDRVGSVVSVRSHTFRGEGGLFGGRVARSATRQCVLVWLDPHRHPQHRAPLHVCDHPDTRT